MERYYTDPIYRKAILARNRARYHNLYKDKYKVQSTEIYNQNDENKIKHLEELRLKFFLEYQAKKKEQLEAEVELLNKKRDEARSLKKLYHRNYYITQKLEILNNSLETKEYPVLKKRGRKSNKELVEFKIEIVNEPKTITFQ